MFQDGRRGAWCPEKRVRRPGLFRGNKNVSHLLDTAWFLLACILSWYECLALLLQARDILLPRLSEARYPDPDDRVSACEDLVSDMCAEIFGERFRLYAQRSEDLCGDGKVIWREDKGIRAWVYTFEDKYDNHREGIVRSNFTAFLFAILIIWLMIVLDELRHVGSWWQFLLAVKTMPSGAIEEYIVGAVHQEDEGDSEGIEIKALPTSLWWFTVLLNVGPRTLVAVGMVVIGMEFLIHADDYTDLVLNSVALGFLFEMDNMLYRSVVSDRMKRITNRCEWVRISGVASNVDRIKDYLWMTPFYTLTMLIVAVAFMWKAYMKEGGKFDIAEGLECLCQSSGSRCLGAALLGGKPHVQFGKHGAYYG
eukprot:TRINITY_DN21473_c0_g1_i3.p1 TRINITY_DN21473_c0_g1~~TRINITY_DN21473_c0_g1_i3.p1  ORF type:complete len:378 (-),score=28.71 TRINITY_DN21473_c0_g1_i3:729-1826(-)